MVEKKAEKRVVKTVDGMGPLRVDLRVEMMVVQRVEEMVVMMARKRAA